MEVVTKYIADDGREFSDEEKCKRYEENLLEREEVIKAMKTLNKFCLKHTECSDCPLGYDDECSLCYHGTTAPGDWSERYYKIVSDDATEENY